MDDLRTPVLDRHLANIFAPLKTIYVVCFSIFLMSFIEFITLAYVFLWVDSPVRCDLFYLLVYAEISLWVVNFIMRSYIKWKHTQCLIANGFFDFDEDCIRFIEIPFYISCIWLGILVVILCLYAEYDVPHDFYCDTKHFYSPMVAVTITITIQNILTIPLFAIYIVKVNGFNKNQGWLNSESSNQWMPNTLQDTLTSADVGYRERYDAIDNMLEKQADLIRYYKEANEVLNKKILQLTAQGHTVPES